MIEISKYINNAYYLHLFYIHIYYFQNINTIKMEMITLIISFFNTADNLKRV